MHKHIDIVKNHVKRMEAGEMPSDINKDLLINGKPYEFPFIPSRDPGLTHDWKPKAITVTIPEPYTIPQRGSAETLFVIFKTEEEVLEAFKVLRGE